MTSEEIIELALQCGIWIPLASDPEREQTIDNLRRFAALVAAAERDALRAAVCHEADCVEACKSEIDALRAKIEAMERQEPSHWGCTVLQSDGRWKEEVSREAPPEGYFSIRDIFPLYALPGAQAQPALSVPEGWKLVPIKPTEEMINKVIYERLDALMSGRDHSILDIYHAMIEVAPEVKSCI